MQLYVNNGDYVQLCNLFEGQNGWVCRYTFLWLVAEGMYTVLHLPLYVLLNVVKCIDCMLDIQ